MCFTWRRSIRKSLGLRQHNNDQQRHDHVLCYAIDQGSSSGDDDHDGGNDEFGYWKCDKTKGEKNGREGKGRQTDENIFEIED